MTEYMIENIEISRLTRLLMFIENTQLKGFYQVVNLIMVNYYNREVS